MRRMEQYRVERGDNIADPGFWNARLEDIDDRLNARETSDSALDGAVQRVEALGVERVAATLNPLVVQAVAKLSEVPALFDALSGTEVTVGDGSKTFILSENDRGLWPRPAWAIAAAVDDPAVYMAGPVVSLDRVTGALTVNVTDTGGAGTKSSWVIRASGLPGPQGEQGDPGAAGATNASQLSATAPAGFTGATAQAVLDSIATEVTSHDTELGQHASALTSHGSAISTLQSGKADTGHSHTTANVTGLDAALAGKQAASTNLTTLAGTTPAAAADYRAGTATDKLLTPASVWGAAAEVTLTYAATVTPDFATGFDFALTLTGNVTLANPTNPKAGQRGRIRIVQDATGSRTVAFGTNWKFAGGTAPSASTAANTEDFLDYEVISSTRIRAALTKAVPV